MQAFNRGAQDNSNHIYVICNINNYTRFLVECQVWPGALPTKKPLQECLCAIKPKILRGTLHCYTAVSKLQMCNELDHLQLMYLQ